MQKRTSSPFTFLLAFLFTLSFGEAQNPIIPQIADGGGWQTTLVLTNTSPSPATAALTFYQETGGSNTQPWNLAFLETSSPQSLLLPAAGTIFLHTPGTAGTTSVGWAQLAANSSVNGYAIFTERVPGRQDQDGTAQAAASSSRVLIPYDNTNGFVTAVALANTTTASEILTVGVQPTSGTSLQPSSITLPGLGHTSFTMPQQFPTTAGQSGLLELSTATISLSALALGFNPTGAFTTAPVYPEAGNPIIASGGSGGGSGGTTLPQFSYVNAGVTFSVAGQAPFNGGVAVSGNPGGTGYSGGAVNVKLSGTQTARYHGWPSPGRMLFGPARTPKSGSP